LLNLDSIIKYKNAISIDSTLSEAYYRLGKRTAITSTAQGHEYYSKAIQYNENFVDAMFAKGNLYYNNYQNNNDIQMGIDLYLKAIQIEPHATDLRINCALAYYSIGKSELALKMARSILRIDSFHRKASALIDEINGGVA
jgi:tetratricopeptide (TPR) repeat protein